MVYMLNHRVPAGSGGGGTMATISQNGVVAMTTDRLLDQYCYCSAMVWGWGNTLMWYCSTDGKGQTGLQYKQGLLVFESENTMDRLFFCFLYAFYPQG